MSTGRHPGLNNYNDAIKDELAELTKKVSDAIPQFNYGCFSTYSILIPQILTIIKSGFTLPQPSSIGVTWNILDAAFQIIGGGLQVHSVIKGDTHTPIATGIEGTVNTLSGTQLLILSTISVKLGAIGFAIAFAVAATFSLKNAATSFKKNIDIDYWLEDSLEILALSQASEEKYILELEKNINEANNKATQEYKLDQENLSFLKRMMIQFIQDKRKKSVKEIEILQEDIFARLIVDYVSRGKDSFLCKKKNSQNFAKLTKNQKECLTEIIMKHNEHSFTSNENKQTKREIHNDIANQQLETFNIGKLTNCNACENRVRKILEKDREETFIKTLDALHFAAACIGMVCLCVPGWQPFAAFFIAPAASYFLVKYSAQLPSSIKSISSFFAKKEDDFSKTPSPTKLKL